MQEFFSQKEMLNSKGKIKHLSKPVGWSTTSDSTAKYANIQNIQNIHNMQNVQNAQNVQNVQILQIMQNMYKTKTLVQACAYFGVTFNKSRPFGADGFCDFFE